MSKIERIQNTSNTPESPRDSALEKDSLQGLELDVTIVLGEGPVKPVLIPQELTEKQQHGWSAFISDPLHTKEPDFYLLDGKHYLEQLEEIHERFDHQLQKAEAGIDGFDERTIVMNKRAALAKKRSEWQHTGRFAMKRMGRQNALAAGVALLHGATKEVVISGGRTIPEWKKEEYREQMLQEFLQYRDLPEEEQNKKLDEYLRWYVKWPSEAELMKDIIVRQFDKDYRKKHNNRPISEVVRVEDKATNTLENIILSINKNPDLLLPTKRIGILSAQHHVGRGETIANRYGITIAEGGRLSAQDLLAERARAHHREKYAEMLEHMRNVPDNTWLQDLVKGELRFMQGLTDEQFLNYWFGYIFKLEDPRNIQKVIDPLLADEKERIAIERSFAEVGLSLDTFLQTDLEQMARHDPTAYSWMLLQLTRLTTDLRIMPPEVTSLPKEFLSRKDHA